jgi:uracil-DNA glycosylase
MKPILLVGEALGESEIKLPGHPPLVGPSGAELIRMLAEAGVINLTAFDRDYLHQYYNQSDPSAINAIWGLHPEVRRTNVFMLHPPRNNLEFFCGGKPDAIPGYPPLLKSKYVRKEFENELDRLASDILSINPNVIVCLGNTALWALAGQTGITKVRGTTLLSTHTVLDYKLLPTYHPAAIIREWTNRPTAIADLMKAKRESAYGEIRRPQRNIYIEPTLDDIAEFTARHIRGCRLLSVDIETSGNRVTCIGFAPTPGLALVVPFDDPRAKGGCYWPTKADELRCWGLVRDILEDASIAKLFQNGMYDIAFLWRAYGIKTLGAREDTMLLSHALHPEALKGLGYLGSIYSDEGSWKFMRKKHETIKRGD